MSLSDSSQIPSGSSSRYLEPFRTISCVLSYKLVSFNLFGKLYFGLKLSFLIIGKSIWLPFVSLKSGSCFYSSFVRFLLPFDDNDCFRRLLTLLYFVWLAGMMHACIRPIALRHCSA